MRYRVIQEYDRRYPIRLMCRALAVLAAGYYAWRSRPESARSIQTRTLLSAIRVIHQELRKTYGSPRIWDGLVKQGHRVGEHRVARLRRVAEIRAKPLKKWCVTTPSNHRLPVAENLLDRQFTVAHSTRTPMECGQETSPLSGHGRAGSIWPSYSICMHAGSSAGRWAPA